MKARWPKAEYVEDRDVTAPLARRVFDPLHWTGEQPLRVVLIGTDFEVRVWQTLLTIPLGRATTYSDIARRIGRPSAARAVGAAVGKNPISFVVPCHRVLGRSGALTGYHWGLTRKQAILGLGGGTACRLRRAPGSRLSGTRRAGSPSARREPAAAAAAAAPLGAADADAAAPPAAQPRASAGCRGGPRARRRALR